MRADRRVLIGMTLGVEVVREDLPDHPVRGVLIALPTLVLYDISLVVELLLCERVEEPLHTI